MVYIGSSMKQEQEAHLTLRRRPEEEVFDDGLPRDYLPPDANPPAAGLHPVETQPPESAEAKAEAKGLHNSDHPNNTKVRGTGTKLWHLGRPIFIVLTLCLAFTSYHAYTIKVVCPSVDLTEGSGVEYVQQYAAQRLADIVDVGKMCDEEAWEHFKSSKNVTITDQSGFDHYQEQWRLDGRPPVVNLQIDRFMHGLDIDCEGSWTEFSECSASCGGGEQTRTYIIIRPSKHGGTACPHARNEVEGLECNAQPCPQDCVLADWTPHQEGCSQPCGTGVLKRTRSILKPAEHGGTCPSEDSSERLGKTLCNEEPCPIKLMEGLQDSVSSAVVTQVATQAVVERIQESKAHLQMHLPVLDCSAGGDSTATGFAYACPKHNEVAQVATATAELLEIGFDECTIAASNFGELTSSLEHHLPWLSKQACEGNIDAALITMDVLVTEIAGVKEQVEKCRVPFRTIISKAGTMRKKLSGFSKDSERSMKERLKDLRNAKAFSSSSEQKIQETADALDKAENNRLSKESSLNSARQTVNRIQNEQADLLSLRRRASDTASSEASVAQQSARDLDASLQGKNRDQGRINRQYAEANEFKSKADQAQQAWEKAVNEYNAAVHAQQAQLRLQTDDLEAEVTRIANLKGQDATVREENLERAKSVRDLLHDIEILGTLRGYSTNVDLNDLDSASQVFLKELVALTSALQKWKNHIETLQTQQSFKPTAKQACEQAQQYVGGLIKSAKVLFQKR